MRAKWFGIVPRSFVGLLDDQLPDRGRSSVYGGWNDFPLADGQRDVERPSGWIRRQMRKGIWIRWKTPLGRREQGARVVRIG